jgi:hypothetical protein
MSLMVVLNNAKDLGSHVVSVQRNSDDWLSASAPGAAAFTHALYLSLGRALQEIRLWRLRQNAGICSKPTQVLSVLIELLRGLGHFMNENRYLYGIMNKK